MNIVVPLDGTELAPTGCVLDDFKIYSEAKLFEFLCEAFCSPAPLGLHDLICLSNRDAYLGRFVSHGLSSA